MSAATTDVRVEIDHGELTGRSQDGVAFFGGIPYTADPIGDLRFALPRPPTWSGPRDARAFGPSAPQFRLPNPPFDLRSIGAPAEPTGPDYLNLNVWTPVEALEDAATAPGRPCWSSSTAGRSPVDPARPRPTTAPASPGPGWC